MSEMKNIAEIYIVAGFLGAGKTTFLNRCLPLLKGKTVVIENEAGTVGVDGTLLPEGFPVRELSAGCICCTLAPQLETQLNEISDTFAPDQIVIEPSGVGNLSDIVRHCVNFGFYPTLKIAMVDASEFEDYADGFGTFYMDQIENANLVLLTHTNGMTTENVKKVSDIVHQSNKAATVLETDWRELSDDALMALLSEAKDEISEDSSHAEKEHHHHHDHNFKNNGFEQVMFENLKIWGADAAEKVVTALDSGECGEVYRAKGFVKTQDEQVKYFDYTPSFNDLTSMEKAITDDDLRFIVIGRNLKKDKLSQVLGCRI